MYAALKTRAGSLIASGDERGRGQIMADTLVERVTGRAGTGTSVEVDLVVSDRILHGDGDEAAYVDGYGPIPAGLAKFIRLRDQVCRMPWRRTDPAHRPRRGCRDRRRDLRGQRPGALRGLQPRQAGVGLAGPAESRVRHTVTTRAPTRHTYASTASTVGERRHESRAELSFRDLILAV